MLHASSISVSIGAGRDVVVREPLARAALHLDLAVLDFLVGRAVRGGQAWRRQNSHCERVRPQFSSLRRAKHEAVRLSKAPVVVSTKMLHVDVSPPSVLIGEKTHALHVAPSAVLMSVNFTLPVVDALNAALSASMFSCVQASATGGGGCHFTARSLAAIGSGLGQIAGPASASSSSGAASGVGRRVSSVTSGAASASGPAADPRNSPASR